MLLKRDAPENKALCEAFRSRLDLEVNVSPLTWNDDGSYVTTRPVYWPVTNARSLSGPKPSCVQLLARYDYERARALMGRLSLQQRGPYLVVANWNVPSGRPRLGGFDLAQVPDDEIAASFDRFSDYFAQQEGRWNPDHLMRAQLRQRIKVFLDRDVGERMWVLLDFAPSAQAGER